MKRRFYIGLVVVLIAVGFIIAVVERLDLNNEESAPAQQTQGFAQPVVATEIGSVKLIEQNNSGQRGSVTVKDWNGKAAVKINLDVEGFEDASRPEEEEEETQPAQLRAGTCQNPGDVKYELENVFDGGGETVLDMDLAQFTATLPLSVTVQKSSTDPTIIVCGEITSL